MPLPSLPAVHLLTCPPRAASLAATPASWDATDWGRLHGRPRVHVDTAEDAPPWGHAARHAPMLAAFRKRVEPRRTRRARRGER